MAIIGIDLGTTNSLVSVYRNGHAELLPNEWGEFMTPSCVGVLEDGTVVTHSHGHTHSHAHTKAVLNRLSRAIGHLESIRRMVEEGRDCSEVLIQLSAVKSAINNTGKVILQDHIEHCIVDAIEHGDTEALEELNKAIDRFMK